MALKSLLLFSLLFQVLLVLVEAQPSWPRETQAERFQRLHVDTRHHNSISFTYCDNRMKAKNILYQDFNTFVCASRAAVQAICNEPVVPCKNGRMNCHKSSSPMSLIFCEKKQRTSDYNTTQGRGHIVIACNVAGEPIHLDHVEN